MRAKDLTVKPGIVGLSAVTSVGRDWPSTWHALLEGKVASLSFLQFGSEFSLDVPVSGVIGLDRSCTEHPTRGATSRLAEMVLTPLSRGDNDSARLYGASNHSESDILLQLSRELPDDSSLWRGLLVDPIPEQLLGSAGNWCSSACTSSLHALFAALMDFSETRTERDAIVVGADALSAVGVMGFLRAKASTHGECRPFNLKHDGILIGEGAAAIRLRYPCSDCGPIKILGFGMSCDAFHPTDPDGAGIWLEKAIRDAVRRTGCDVTDIAAIISHGTGTPKNDLVEGAVYERIWPEGRIPITSIKGALGHTMGASGLLNVLVAVEASKTGLIPPTLGGDGYVIHGLDLVQGMPRQIKSSSLVLAVASGFGGNNCACVIGPDSL